MVSNASAYWEEGAGKLLCDRRALLVGSACAAGLLAAPAAIAQAQKDPARRANLSFFDDRPMLDNSGKLPTYRPPDGFRGAGSLSGMDEARLRYIAPFMT